MVDDDFAEAFFRESLLLLNNLGIHVAKEECPSWRALQTIKARLYPSGLFQKAFNWAYFALNPEAKVKLFDAMLFFENAVKTEFLSLVLDRARALCYVYEPIEETKMGMINKLLIEVVEVIYDILEAASLCVQRILGRLYRAEDD